MGWGLFQGTADGKEAQEEMTAEVVNLFEDVDYVIACPDCGCMSLEIHVDDFDLSVACILFVECLDCGKRVGLKGG